MSPGHSLTKVREWRGTAVLRRFNRSYTQRIGALDESFMGLGLPLGSARLLFEIGAEEAPTVQRLRARLGLDSGYLSRLLRSLEEQDLVAVEPDPADRRRRLVRLTARGRRTRTKLDDRSEELAARLVAPLSDRQRARLSEALATADLLVRAATVDLRAGRPHRPGRPRRRWTATSPSWTGASTPGSTPAPATTPSSTGRRTARSSWPAATATRWPAAACSRSTNGTAEIKRMWVHDDWRGAGLGARMLRRLEDDAARGGLRRGRASTPTRR